MSATDGGVIVVDRPATRELTPEEKQRLVEALARLFVASLSSDVDDPAAASRRTS